MRQKLYIGNLPFSATEADVRRIFRKYEPVHSVLIVADRDTKESRGFGFIELEDSSAAAAAAELNQRRIKGRPLIISPATGGCPRYAVNGNAADDIADGDINGNVLSDTNDGANDRDILPHRKKRMNALWDDSDSSVYHLYKFDENGAIYCGKGKHVN